MKNMQFRFLSIIQVAASPMQKPTAGYRELTMHGSAVSEATDRFLQHRLARKRERLFGSEDNLIRRH